MHHAAQLAHRIAVYGPDAVLGPEPRLPLVVDHPAPDDYADITWEGFPVLTDESMDPYEIMFVSAGVDPTLLKGIPGEAIEVQGNPADLIRREWIEGRRETDGSIRYGDPWDRPSWRVYAGDVMAGLSVIAWWILDRWWALFLLLVAALLIIDALWPAP